ncbi:hypothetical protein [Rufibacter psychrotolerans]|uniref:hypothetical protein n=1 Tax=Rufibacter psychrotolerans TaxID=2812556 RepID=UPI001967BF45|nr:hypothetical protein [Rufibacter sp. SYSU D00308]
MTQLTVGLESEADFNIIRIDDEEVLRGSGTKTGDLSRGLHVMTWQIKGQKGNKYTLSITEPEKASFTRSITLDSFGLDFGFHEIEL